MQAKTRINGHILVADDDLVGQLLIAGILEQAAYKVDVVSDGLEVIKAVESIDYDLVVMDCFMPGMDGFAATQAIRATESKAINPDVPIIALTTLELSDDVEKCRDAGMDDYVSKPADPILLIAAIERCLGRAFDEHSSLEQPESAPAVGPPGDNEAGMQEQPIWDPNFRDSVIDQFLEKVPQEVASLQEALRRENLVELQDIGHRIRGSAAFLEASKLSVRAAALEQAAKVGDLALATQLTSELIKELRKLTAALSEE